ncbi:TIGR02234 family membrane protein [Streptomyces sp. AJS327]|uniref:TIGR02234 family membrane protein n=1 Tax=Streptomyces sp. AJS327 TaxID=2545265 RepID=UPI0015DF397C|nr:TIGR02234 family membrane protein [Streptomyces sp. AJS327]MBA0050374.1 TIGR02234 family membrane protein [Streptomyces sp. AJS327]
MTSPTPARGPGRAAEQSDGTDAEPRPAAEEPSGGPEAGSAARGEEGATTAGTDGGRVVSAARASRRSLALALLCAAAGAALALISGGQRWSSAEASFAGGTLPVSAEGGEVTGLPSALALVGLAALVAVFAVRRVARRVVAALLTLCGVATLAAALFGADDTGALEEKASKASGIAESGVGTVDLTAWPYLSATGGALLLCAGLLALRYGRAWPSMAGTGRYDRSPTRPTRAGVAARSGRGAAPRVDPDRPEDLWKALDRGEDPTGEPDTGRRDGA